MNDLEFTYLRQLLRERSGLSLSVEKRYLVESRLAAVCRESGIKSLSELIRSARLGNHSHATAIVEAMTTNETLFFRDTTPFNHVRDMILPTLLKARSAEKTIRIWCAAASSGQEPYSLAMLLDDMAPRLAGWRIEILATDISHDILEKARAAVYNQFEVQRGLPVQLLLKHFAQEGDCWRLSDRIRRMVTFRQHNLIEPSNSLGVFDLVLCRNVLIYFDGTTKASVFGQLARAVRSDGYLLLGAAETVMGLTDAFTIDREHRGVYRPAVATGAAPSALEPRALPALVVGPALGAQPQPAPSLRPATTPLAGQPQPPVVSSRRG